MWRCMQLPSRDRVRGQGYVDFSVGGGAGIVWSGTTPSGGKLQLNLGNLERRVDAWFLWR